MTPEMIAILAVGAALAGLIWQGQRGLRADQQSLRTELRADQQSLRAELIGRMDGIESRMDGIESRMDGIESRMGRIESRLTELGDRVSRIEGMLHWHFGRNEEPPALAE